MKYSLIVLLLLLITSCSKQKEKNAEGSEVKTEQYMIAGKQLYTKHCSMCHQSNGAGLARLYPPLNESDYMKNHLNDVICLIKYGVSEPLTVNGIIYTQPMPGVRNLTNLEIAEIATYIYNSWEHERGIINVKEVDKILQNCEN